MHRIGFAVFPNFHLLAFSAVTAFETANLVLEHPGYAVTLLSEHGGPVPASAGFRVETQPSQLSFGSVTAVARGGEDRLDVACEVDVRGCGWYRCCGCGERHGR